MPSQTPNKYRAAVEILQQGRDQLVDALADEIVFQGTDLIEGGFLFNEFLEVQGTRLHFLSLLVSQLEQAAELTEEVVIAPPQRANAQSATKPSPKKRAKSKPKKVEQKIASEGSAEDG